MTKDLNKFKKAWLHADIKGIYSCFDEDLNYTSITLNMSLIGKLQVIKHFEKQFKILAESNASAELVKFHSPTNQIEIIYHYTIWRKIPHYMVNKNGVCIVFILEPLEIRHHLFANVTFKQNKIKNITVDQKIFTKCRKAAFIENTFVSEIAKNRYNEQNDYRNN